MTEFTDKLELPIPEINFAGDVNDVEAMAETIQAILDLIDRAAGDYVAGDTTDAGLATPSAAVLPALTGYENIESVKRLSAILEDGGSTMHPSNADTLSDDDEDGFLNYEGSTLKWPLSMETEFIKLNEDGTINVKRAGNYTITVSVGYNNNVEEGVLGGGLARTDIEFPGQDFIPAFFLPWATLEPINQCLVTTVTHRSSLKFGPTFYSADTVLEPVLWYANTTDTPTEDALEVTSVNVVIERL